MENIVSAETTPQTSFEVPNLDTLSDSQAVAPAENSQDPNVHTNNANDSQIEIDERYKDLPVGEATIRTLQSQRDKQAAEYTKLMKDYEEKSKITGVFDQMLEDEGLLMAFIREVKPDLVKSVDLGTQLKQQLQKEFGEDFKPTMSRDEAEREDPFGNDAKYYMRVDSLKTKLLEGGSQENLTIKEYLAKKKQAEQVEASKYEAERESVKTQFKMQDEEVKAVSDWAMKLQFKNLVQLHRFLRKFPTQNPNLNQATGSPEGMKSDRQKFLKNVF